MANDKKPHLVGVLKRLCAMSWQGLEYRVELAANEMQESTRRMLVIVVLTQVALYSAFLAFVCLNVLVFAIFWDGHRTTVAIILCVLYLALALIVGAVAWRRLKTAPRPLASTLEELKKDRVAMGKVES